MMGSRIASALRAALAAGALAGATLLAFAPSTGHVSATGPATCLPHCDNALYPYMESVRATGDEASASTGTVLPGTPPSGG